MSPCGSTKDTCFIIVLSSLVIGGIVADSHHSFHLEPVRTLVIQGDQNQNYTRQINNTIEYVFQYNFNRSDIRNDSFSGDIRIHVDTSEDVDEDYPILFVARQQKQVLSWQLPLKIGAESDGHKKITYFEASRTLCSDLLNATTLQDIEQTVFVSVSTASRENVQFTLQVVIEKNFVMEIGENYSRNVAVPSPMFFQFIFPPRDTTKYILLEVKSEDEICMTVSVQDLKCPVRDQELNVEFTGYWQTMMTKAGMTISREKYPNGFYVVFVVHSDDSRCTNDLRLFGNHKKPVKLTGMRIKNVTFSVSEKINDRDYYIATASSFSVFLMFYFIAFICSCVYSCRTTNPVVLSPEDGGIDSQNNHPSQSVNEHSPILSCGPAIASTPYRTPRNFNRHQQHQQSNTAASTSTSAYDDTDSSLDEVDIDMLEDAYRDKNIVRTSGTVYVAQLARKNPKILTKKAQLYLWTLFTVAVFYSLPVVQLVFTYQQVLHTTGNQDLCYYNYLCSHPFWILSDFNHVFSNIGYIMLGLLFVLLTNRRNRMHEKLAKANNDLELNYGIPRHFGLFYAMGAALVMEGILSACYHVCPNYSNFQFDTCFMYVNAMLCILKLYQTRHPDINASAYMTFASLALVVFIAVLGVMVGSIYFWVCFTTLHVVCCYLLSLQIYYLGRWKLDSGLFRRVYRVWWNDCLASPLSCLTPLYPDRLVFVVLANGGNWALAAFGIYRHHDFASHLLAIFMANLLLYITFYIIMKLRHKERILLQPFMYLTLSIIMWSLSLVVFIQKSTSWQTTPAQSRMFNRECLLLKFFDLHDIWHFLSAGSMFFSFMLLLTLDDDLVSTPRTKIAVF